MILDEVTTIPPDETIEMLKSYYDSEDRKVVNILPTVISDFDIEQTRWYYRFGFAIWYENETKPFEIDKEEASEKIALILKQNNQHYNEIKISHTISKMPNCVATFDGVVCYRNLGEKPVLLYKRLDN